VPVTSLGAPTRSLGAPGSASDKPGRADHKPESAGNQPGSTSNHSRAVWEEQHLLGNSAGAPGNYSYYLSFNDVLKHMYSVCILIYVCVYQ